MRDGELWLIGLYIPPYGPAARANHEPERPRKLLLHRSRDRAADRPDRASAASRWCRRGSTFRERSRAKVEIALARGKDLYDKRESIRKRDMVRDVQRELRDARR